MIFEALFQAKMQIMICVYFLHFDTLNSICALQVGQKRKKTHTFKT